MTYKFYNGEAVEDVLEGMEFNIVNYPYSPTVFEEGMLVKLLNDDGSDIPEFINLDGNRIYMHWYNLNPVGSEDMVNQPPHYNKGGVECIEGIKASMSNEKFKGYLKGNLLKYVWRYEDKGGLEDLRKAEFYLNRLMTEEIVT